jgi:signal transduction histidine kinase
MDDNLLTLRCTAPSSGVPDTRTASAADAPAAEASVTASAAAPSIDAATLSQLAHDLRSPLTVLVCNRRFLQEIVARAGIEDPELREILEDDAAALARLEQAVAGLDVIARRSR